MPFFIEVRMDKNTRLICVGKIVAAHGIKGEVKIHAYTEDPYSLATYSPLMDSSGNKLFKIKIRSCSDSILIAAIEGVSTRTEAEAIRKKELFVPRDRLPVLEEENTFYLEDLKGLPVLEGTERRVFGIVKDVYNFGASDIVAIIRADTNQEELFAFTHDIFPEVNLSDGYILMSVS